MLHKAAFRPVQWVLNHLVLMCCVGPGVSASMLVGRRRSICTAWCLCISVLSIFKSADMSFVSTNEMLLLLIR